MSINSWAWPGQDMLQHYPWPRETGCICPAAAEQTCKNDACPRQSASARNANKIGNDAATMSRYAGISPDDAARYLKIANDLRAADKPGGMGMLATASAAIIELLGGKVVP